MKILLAALASAGLLAAQADQPAPRTDKNSQLAHEQLLGKIKQGRIDVYFVGDSIVRRWGALDYPELLANWTQNFYGWNAGNFGWGADRTQNILWRLENGELDGVNPKVIVVLAGTNNVGAQPRTDSEIAEIAGGVKAIVDTCRRKAPGAAIVLTAIFPRNDNMAAMPAMNMPAARFTSSPTISTPARSSARPRSRSGRATMPRVSPSGCSKPNMCSILPRSRHLPGECAGSIHRKSPDPRTGGPLPTATSPASPRTDD